jgi:hypothetical protein
VKGVTVSRGPDLKRRPEDLENKRKIDYSKEILLFWAPKLSGPKLAYSVCKKVGFTGPDRALFWNMVRRYQSIILDYPI